MRPGLPRRCALERPRDAAAGRLGRVLDLTRILLGRVPGRPSRGLQQKKLTKPWCGLDRALRLCKRENMPVHYIIELYYIALLIFVQCN